MKAQPTHWRYRLATLREQALRRPPGYLEDCLKHAAWYSPDGTAIYMLVADAERLSARYAEFWQPEIARKSSAQKGPAWWRPYEGKLTFEEVQTMSLRIFDLEDAVDDHPVMLATRQSLLRRLAAAPEKCSPCQMKKIVSATVMEFVFSLNTHEKSS